MAAMDYGTKVRVDGHDPELETEDLLVSTDQIERQGSDSDTA